MLVLSLSLLQGAVPQLSPLEVSLPLQAQLPRNLWLDLEVRPRLFLTHILPLSFCLHLLTTDLTYSSKPCVDPWNATLIGGV